MIFSDAAEATGQPRFDVLEQPELTCRSAQCGTGPQPAGATSFSSCNLWPVTPLLLVSPDGWARCRLRTSYNNSVTFARSHPCRHSERHSKKGVVRWVTTPILPQTQFCSWPSGAYSAKPAVQEAYTAKTGCCVPPMRRCSGRPERTGLYPDLPEGASPSRYLAGNGGGQRRGRRRGSAARGCGRGPDREERWGIPGVQFGVGTICIVLCHPRLQARDRAASFDDWLDFESLAQQVLVSTRKCCSGVLEDKATAKSPRR